MSGGLRDPSRAVVGAGSQSYMQGPCQVALRLSIPVHAAVQGASALAAAVKRRAAALHRCPAAPDWVDARPDARFVCTGALTQRGRGGSASAMASTASATSTSLRFWFMAIWRRAL